MTRTCKRRLYSDIACFIVGGVLVVSCYLIIQNYQIGVAVAVASALLCEIADYIDNRNFSCSTATPVMIGVFAGLVFIMILIQLGAGV